MKCSIPSFLHLPVTSTNSQFPSESPLIFMFSDGNYCILFFYHNHYLKLHDTFLYLIVSSTFIVPPYCINHPYLFPCTSLELLENCSTFKKKRRKKKRKKKSSSSGTGSAVASILDRLKCPRPSDLARKCKIAANLTPTGKRTCRGHGGTPLDSKER